MKVMKFGGSSLEDAARIKATAAIILEARRGEEIAVVLSAMRGVTDQLILASGEAERGDARFRERLRALAERQTLAARELLGGGEAADTASRLTRLLAELDDLFTGIELLRECSERTLDLVMSFGERLNCVLVAGYLRTLGESAAAVDARAMIRTDGSHGRAEVDLAESYRLIRSRLAEVGGIPIITGFIASAGDGSTTTLGRDGSDYTASIVGAAIGARAIEIWTDVDGIMSADPRFVTASFVIPEMSYREAMELSYFGAKVIHPNTMIPAVEKGLPILIKNALNPAARGTLISSSSGARAREVTGIASIENVALVNVEGGGMIGVPGIASKVFLALARERVNVIMISQASSEHSICLVCSSAEAGAALAALERELEKEIRLKKILPPELVGDLEIIAIIGERMRGTPGISGRLFGALGSERVNVLAIAQGSSELNISLVVERADKVRALNAIHRAFLEGSHAVR